MPLRLLSEPLPLASTPFARPRIGEQGLVGSSGGLVALAFLTLMMVLSSAPPAAAMPTSVNATSAKPPKGVVLIVHGGGWKETSDADIALMRPVAKAFNDAGWSTRIQAQHGGLQSYADVINGVASLKKSYGSTPLCIYGESSGGHLALLTAAAMGDHVRCVIAEAAPTWLNAPGDTGGHQYVRGLAISAFTESALGVFSPLTYAAQTRAQILMVSAENDPLIAPWQAQMYAARKPGTKTVLLPPGDVRWIHSDVSPAALRSAGKRVLSFLAGNAAGAPSSVRRRRLGSGGRVRKPVSCTSGPVGPNWPLGKRLRFLRAPWETSSTAIVSPSSL